MVWMKTKKFEKNMKKIVKVFKKKLKQLMLAKRFEYGKDFQKIMFKSKDDLPLNKPIKLRLLTIIIRSVFSKGSKFFPQLVLDDIYMS